MNILVTGANHPFARAAIAALQPQHNILAVDVALDASLPASLQPHAGDLRDPAFVNLALRGVEAVLHVAPLTQPFASDQDNLDHAACGTHQLMQAAQSAGVKQIIVASALALFDCFPAPIHVGPTWRPRPQPRASDFCAYAAEILARECVRTGTLHATCIRVGEASADEIGNTLNQLLSQTAPKENWSVVHLGQRADPNASMPQITLAAKPIKKVLVLGAGGPIGASTVRAMQDHYELRLADVKPFEEIVATAQPQSPGAPLPFLPSAPHQTQVVDVTNPNDVLRACEGMDAIVNLTVIRHDPAQAWRVNMLGAWNVMQAALAHGIQRVVHTGPWQMGRTDGAGYHWDYEVVDDVPPRPGGHLETYLASKLIGQEMVRVFAEHYRFCVPSLLFCGFVNPDWPLADYMGQDLWPFSCTWMDTARAIKAAVDVDSLPSPFEIMHINADLPHGVYPNTKAKRLLNWQPQDDLSKYWITS
jgi:nucleoside-diphosphate-sugar epimerase